MPKNIKRNRIKRDKISTILLIIFCAFVLFGDFYLAWSRMITGDYGWAFLWFILGLIVAHCFRVNLKTLEMIKKRERELSTKGPRG